MSLRWCDFVVCYVDLMMLKPDSRNSVTAGAEEVARPGWYLNKLSSVSLQRPLGPMEPSMAFEAPRFLRPSVAFSTLSALDGIKGSQVPPNVVKVFEEFSGPLKQTLT